MYAPAGLPGAVLAQLTAETEKVARGSAFRERLVALGVAPRVLTGGAFADFQRAELEKWGKAVRDSGATID